MGRSSELVPHPPADTAVNKTADLDPALAAAAPIKTSPVMTLIGVIKHLTAVEREWFTRVGGGSDLPSLWENDPEFDWSRGE